MEPIKQRIEKLIKDAEQAHAESIVAGLALSNALEDILDDLYWAYREACEFDE